VAKTIDLPVDDEATEVKSGTSKIVPLTTDTILEHKN
jgi:hypothetical protein